MDTVKQEAARASRGEKLGYLAVIACFGLGVVFFLLDRIMGYNTLTCSLAAYALWATALFLGFYLWKRKGLAFIQAKFDAARTIIYTLRDDVAPRKLVTGWLDLSGAQLQSKIVRQGRSRSGRRRKVYYRDHWLQLKIPLADGNLLRLSLIEKVKTKTGYAPKRLLQAKARLVVNPQVYRIKPLSQTDLKDFPLRGTVEEKGGVFYISGTLNHKTCNPWPLLRALKFVYQYLEPIGTIR